MLNPSNYILPDGENVLFTLDTEYAPGSDIESQNKGFLHIEVIIKVKKSTTDEIECIFIAILKKSKEIEFARILCNLLTGNNAWFYVGFGVNYSTGTFRGGVVY